jgi:hypothetical protein
MPHFQETFSGFFVFEKKECNDWATRSAPEMQLHPF